MPTANSGPTQQAAEMARISQHLYRLMGVVAEHLTVNVPRGAIDLAPGDDPIELALQHAMGNRGFAVYSYAARSLGLLRSFAVLYQHALPAGSLAIARTCVEQEAAALIAGYATETDFEAMAESSRAWAAKHRFHADGTPIPPRLKGATWTPAKLLRRMKVTAEAGHYSIPRCEQITFYHGYLSYLEAHADFALSVASMTTIDGLPLAGFSANSFAANAAATATAWAASIGAGVVGVSDDDLCEAVSEFETAVPIPMVAAD